MDNKMLIDADHPEETRVVVVRGNRVEEFDFEAENKKQLRGNIYLAKVTRVEPSLQAAFVDYGGNRHGFLAFSEIHPDYYQIPVADRQALLEEEARVNQENRERDDDDQDDSNIIEVEIVDDGEDEPVSNVVDVHSDPEAENEAAPDEETTETLEATSADTNVGADTVAENAEEDEADDKGGTVAMRAEDDDDVVKSEPVEEPSSTNNDEEVALTVANSGSQQTESDEEAVSDVEAEDNSSKMTANEESAETENTSNAEASSGEEDGDEEEKRPRSRRRNYRRRGGRGRTKAASADEDDNDDNDDSSDNEEESVESVGSEDALEEVPERRSRPRVRQYKIQEVIKRRQIILVQVVKEERGNKGAALTTYLSLAGRYSVLMPNTDRGGGISRKITNQTDRKRLRTIANDLDVPEGMGVILRTAGASRTKTEIKRDFEYLMRLWENVRDFTLKSSAPCLVYEEGSLLKRSIRDLYNKDIKQVIVSGDKGYREAKDFMRMLMPSHAKNVQPYKDGNPIFARYGVEAQLDAMFSPEVTLKSGGYIVINQTEALVSIDVNSGKATRERSIEDTALSTNIEAAEEVSRQLRLRDLAGLVVIDFIDMEEKRNNRAVERKLKECLRNDRARIQVGRISHFGLLEMSRQRIRAGVLESTMETCPSCQGTGYVRAPSSVALYVLRAIEDYLIRGSKYNLIVRCRTEVALYVLNNKRTHLSELESRFGLTVMLEADETLGSEYCSIVRGERAEAPKAPISVTPDMAEIDQELARDAELDAAAEALEKAQIAKDETGPEEDEDTGQKKRRRRRRKKSDDQDNDLEASSEDTDQNEVNADSEDEEGGRKKRRRRGRRGGRKDRGRNQDEENSAVSASERSDGSESTEVESKEDTINIETAEETDILDEVTVEGEVPNADDASVDVSNVNDVPVDASSASTVTETDEKEAIVNIEAEPANLAEETGTEDSEPQEEKPEEPKKAGRSGWWQRRSFF